MTGERIVETRDEQSARESEEDSGEAVLVWNGLVADIRPVPWPDAPATTSTRAPEATEPRRTRTPAPSR